ncbi:Enamine deaminase RidA, house cleaning of reactive enamine intermediates, YjgF/YER057c/UK114 family [Bryocella elongata]|uniref:Enamine deaminase RidA, house cleaning of reactive enamine intermediates, YjgF/YER057c/UK114 family n=1 Tax=Bryocella elongata TaxID=863522 RepID=A0A1H5UTY5_9BACT|nr:RidA family protein [Bryocella elongata]SEF77931.1 Enamine deaminase RidA, house cleaning of reactive enamine intermediates, YjgF/YER057c/UK114 family [Bryocella elongata]
MSKQSRRSLLMNAASAAVAVTGVTVVEPAVAQTTGKLEKKSYPVKKNADNASAAPPLFSSAVSYGNLLFLAGVGAHFKGTIEEHTKHVLDELEKNLIGAGSSMEKVLKVNVYLNDINDWEKMNTVYAGRWGKVPPVRTTIAPAGGIPGNSLVEIDLIAYI